MKKSILTAGVVVVVSATGSFYGGMKYAQTKSAPINPSAFQRGQFGGQQRQGNGNRAMNRGGFVNGEIIKKTDDSITLNIRDGGSKIIFFDKSTTISRSTDGTAEDLTAGETVMVNGKTNSDGSIAAQNIQIRPELPEGVNNQGGQGNSSLPGTR